MNLKTTGISIAVALSTAFITGCQSKTKPQPARSMTQTPHHTSNMELKTGIVDANGNVISRNSKKANATLEYDVDQNGIIRNPHLKGSGVPKMLQ